MAGPRYMTEVIFNDVIVWEVLARTEHTITIREMAYAERVRTEVFNSDPFAVAWIQCVPIDNGRELKRRRRKDGTFRTHKHGRPLIDAWDPIGRSIKDAPTAALSRDN